ncbi:MULTISPECIES: substrate-binding periplasmic protein [Roseateles]|uniref:Transporter substrate-binding domain-containing protein n=1 Tax=Roseateles albus TaxID=2987525 RepID=A0ABT5KDA4_9BURK|nr:MULTISPECIES: transporter substrate-binding domain-containing protein [Roseateles]MCV2360418.1 transporter substrate-binding domain-containing protein [Paucibacter sp. TC2R-5]MDC8771907.1 transporter substrate-binding domain-containing protein [Roseateles albus]
MPTLLRLLGFYLVLSAAACDSRADTVRIATGELPPYATESRPDKGIALSIVRRAFELAGHKAEFYFQPWSRAQMETKSGLWDASAHWGASAERRRDFLLSDNILTEQWLIVHRKSIALQWTQPRDLRPYTLGVIRDYTYTPEFWALIRSNELRSDNTPNDLAGLRKMIRGRIDAMPMERNVACDLLTHNFSAQEREEFAAHPRLLTDSFSTHLILPPQQPRSAALLADFNRGLKALRDSGEHARLLQTVQCPPSWANSALPLR